MVEWCKLTDPEIDALDRNLPVLLPIGLVEAHGPHLQSGFDAYAAEWFARRLCEETGCILLPTLPYGFADTNWEYASTLGVSAQTLGMVVADLCTLLCHHGFFKVIVISGHGGNSLGVTLGFQTAFKSFPHLQPAHWCYFTVGGVPMRHADDKETSLGLAIGGVVHMERAIDFELEKPWHEVYSRKRIAPGSGGTNGPATAATVQQGREIVGRLLPTLLAKLRQAMASGTSGGGR